MSVSEEVECIKRFIAECDAEDLNWVKNLIKARSKKNQRQKEGDEK